MRIAGIALALALIAAPAAAARPDAGAVVLFDTGLYLEVTGWTVEDDGRIRLEIPGGAVVVPADRVVRVERDGRAVWTATRAPRLPERDASG